MPIKFVLFFTSSPICSLSLVGAVQEWWNVPLDFAEDVLWLGEINIGRDGIRERDDGGSKGHGDGRQLSYQFNVKMDDGRFAIYGF